MAICVRGCFDGCERTFEWLAVAAQRWQRRREAKMRQWQLMSGGRGRADGK